jgi:hypothetical protein
MAWGVALVLVAMVAGPAAAEGLPQCTGSDLSGGWPVQEALINAPAIGAETSVEIGESMIDASKLTTYATNPVLPRAAHFEGRYGGGAFDVTFPAGVLNASAGGPHIYVSPESTFQYRWEGRPRGKKWGPDVALVWMPTPSSRLIGQVTFGFITRTYEIPDATLTVSHCATLGATGFRREIVYSGVSKGVLSLLYREFTDGLARPAFSQQLTYDLSDGDEIGYKGARFKVLKATNTSIRYVVLKPLADGS